ncbi:MAG: glycosyltransferase family 4 protein [Candidatus Sericytochromatia bacterium]|nr:glycosyltransferase family 4 protein [Candidatus Tanganyikabacteria bacterium]
MRIGMLSWEYPPRIVGGIARHVEELSQALVRKGHEVHVFTADHPDTAEHEVVGGVHLHRARGGEVAAPTRDFVEWVLHLNFGLARMALQTQRIAPFDVFHAHDWLVVQAANLLKKSVDVPLIGTVHATEAGRNKGIHHAMSRYIAQQEWYLTFESYQVVVCSSTMFHEVQGQFGVPQDKIHVIPNGIDPTKFHFDFPERMAFRRRFALDFEKIVLFVGRMVVEKGGQFLLEAASHIIAQYPDAKFVIVGKGGFVDELKARAAALRLGHKCLFTGYVDDDTLVRLYRVADVSVAPSLYEPFGIVALEGMAAGVPVVASDAGGLWEIIEHDVTGVTTYAGDVQSLAWGILQVLSRPDHAQWLVQNAFERVERVFNWDRIAEQTEGVYRLVAGDQHQVPAEREASVPASQTPASEGNHKPQIFPAPSR